MPTGTPDYTTNFQNQQSNQLLGPSNPLLGRNLGIGNTLGNQPLNQTNSNPQMQMMIQALLGNGAPQ